MKATHLFLIALFLILLGFLSPPYTLAQDTYRASLLKGIKARLGKGGMTDIKFSHDGTRLVVGSYTGGIWVYDAQTGDEVFPLAETRVMVSAIAFSPDGSIASGGREVEIGASQLGNSDIQLWKLGTGGHLTLPNSKTDRYTALDFSPDGSLLASGGKNGVLQLWQTATGQELADLTHRKASIAMLAFSPDGETLASCSGNQISLWDTKTHRLQATFKGHKAKVGAVAFSPDGKLLASGSHGKIRLWDLAAQRERLTFSRDTNTVLALAFLGDSKTLASVDKDGTIRLWDAATGDLRTTYLRLIEDSQVLAFSPNGTTIAVGDWAGNLEVWETATGRSIFSRLTGHIGVISTLAFTPDSRTLVSGGRAGVFRVWDVETETLQLASQVGRGSSEWIPIISADGSTFAAGMPAEPEAAIHVSHATSGKWEVSIAPKHKGDWVMALSPDGTRLAIGGGDGSIFVVDTETGEDILRFVDHLEGINTLVFSPDGNRVASSSRDGKILVWDVASADVLFTFPEVCGYLAFSPDGKTLASVDKGIKLWDLETGDLKVLSAYEGIGTKAHVFSPDSRTLVTGGFHLRAWDVDTGSLIVDLQPYLGDNDLRLVRALAFSPDGQTLAVGDSENILLWDWNRVAFWGTPFDR